MAGETAGRAFVAGNASKSDCVARYTPGGASLSIRIESSVAVLFGRAIESAARRVAATFGATTGELAVKDDGALDHVIEARVEAALRDAGFGPDRGSAGFAGARGLPAGAFASPRARRRRSRLYLPGDNPDLAVNAGLFGADCVVLDLEDSVAPSRKAEARILVRRTLESCRGFFGDAEIVVRMNPLSGPYGPADLAEIGPAFPQALILPKCESAAEVEELDRALSRLEAEAGLPAGAILLMPLVETARGVLASAAIAAASSRNAALCFGAEDFSRDIGARRTAEGAESLVARQSIVMAARAAGIQAHDSVFSDVEDESGLAASCVEARAFGFDGKGLVHPRQVAVAHDAFDPSPEELAEAARVVEALELAEASGSGVASLEGKMIDAPVAARARRIIGAGSAAGRD